MIFASPSDYQSFVEALSHVMGPRYADLMLRYLGSSGAITDGRLDTEKLESSLAELFGSSAQTFFDLLMKLSKLDSAEK